ncbi:hypothetical protein GA0070607_3158 [Micromonospora coriariae]|uniref:Uncharacterized protein n=1 Tax=Micromonospora coriariae TaxID=285665 RepID=A0A1C4W5M9_9ACTN|nr:DUF1624 domain-containing protein [Micromonospora coriariae]SCE91478.1 hypothetical protein GA0070607_3158 [Micromonospora coriariae]
MNEPGRPSRWQRPPEKPDQWNDFRRGIALLSMVLFFFCVVGLGFLLYQLATLDGDAAFDGWSFVRFPSVAVPLGVAAVMGVRVYRAASNSEAKSRGRVMGLALLAAAAPLIQYRRRKWRWSCWLRRPAR